MSPDQLQKGIDFFNSLINAFKSQSPEDHTFYQNLKNAIERIDNNFAKITGSLAEVSELITKVGTNMLESSAILAVQQENAVLTVHSSKMERRQRLLIGLIRDLSAPCLGCKKAKWAPHLSDCEWASDIERTLAKFEEDLNVRFGAVQADDQG